MKKLWFAALLMALALIVTGCPGEADPEEEEITGEDLAAKNLFLTGTEGGTAVANNTITTTQANQFIYVYFDPPGEGFNKLVLDFTATPGENLTIVALYGFHNDGYCTWGQDPWNTNWLESGPLEIDPAGYTSDWSSTGTGSINKATIRGFAISVANETTFTLTGVTFTGIGDDSPTPPPPSSSEDSNIKILFKGTEKTAVVKGSSSVTVTGNSITVAWNDQDEGGAYRAKFELSEAEQVNLSSGYSKFVMEWTSGSAAGGNFNISLYFPGNRMLSNYAASGRAEFDFVTHHPDWAAGTSWGGAEVSTITGFEIWSGDNENFGASNLVITKISFE